MTNSEHTTLDEQRLAELMVKVVDKVATPAEREELMRFVVDDPDLRRELESQQAFKAVTDGWMDRLEADLAADRDRADVVRSAERCLGVGLVLLGLALLWAWGIVELLLDPSAPLPVKLGMGALGAGSLLLLVHVVRVRWFSGDADPYSKVIR